MSKPTTQALKCLKHLILYLSGTAARATLLPYTSVGTRLITQLNGSVDMEITQEAGHVVEAYSDSDWGSLKTPEKARRKSTSSGIIVLNGIQVRHRRQQPHQVVIYALSGTCGEAILVGRLFEFLTEKPVSVEVRCDSSSARQWTQRRGVGRLKHVDVRLCQLQDWVRDNIVKLGTVKTALNVADLNTKKLSYARRACWKQPSEEPHQTHSSVQCNSSIDRILDQRKPCSCRDWRSLRKQPYHGRIGHHVNPVGYCSGSIDCTANFGSLGTDHETSLQG